MILVEKYSARNQRILDVYLLAPLTCNSSLISGMSDDGSQSPCLIQQSLNELRESYKKQMAENQQGLTDMYEAKLKNLQDSLDKEKAKVSALTLRNVELEATNTALQKKEGHFCRSMQFFDIECDCKNLPHKSMVDASTQMPAPGSPMQPKMGKKRAFKSIAIPNARLFKNKPDPYVDSDSENDDASANKTPFNVLLKKKSDKVSVDKKETLGDRLKRL